jgi:transposase
VAKSAPGLPVLDAVKGVGRGGGSPVRVTTVMRKLLGCRELIVTSVGFGEEGLVLDVKPRWRRPRCGQCGRTRSGHDRSAPRRWRHLSLGRVRFWFRYAPRRVNCRLCGVITERVPWAAHDSVFTRDLEEMTAYLAQRMDKTAVRKQMGINWRTVGTIVKRIVSERLDPARLEDLYVIGVDEISFRRHHEYLTCVVDHLKGRIVWAGEGKSGDTLRRFFDELGPARSAEIGFATVDLAAAYIGVIRERAPQAQLAYDRFHVQRLASDAVDKVRREQVHELAGTAEAASVKHSRWALLKNPWNLTQREGEKLREVQRSNMPLYRAYLLKEELARGLDMRQPNVAERHLNEWISWALRSRLKPFVRVARTIKKHIDGILTYIRTRLTNGLVEGLNNKTRLITRRAYGFHGAQALAAMVFLCCGGITLDPPLPLPTDAA